MASTADFIANAARFRTTRWSMVVRAGQENAETGLPALEELCRAYWYPLYLYVRRKGHDAHTAQDLTQAFFARLLEKNLFAVADQERGRFRTFLLSALANFLHNEHEHATREKRGGGAETFSLDAVMAEEKFQKEPSVLETPEKIFERRWVETLLENVLARVREENRAAGELERFELLKIFLVEDKGTVSFSEMGSRLNMTEAAVKGVVRRLRARYREIFREEVAHTVASPDEVDAEIRYLLTTFE